MNALLNLKENGQSVWLDHINRNLLQSGELAQLIEDDGVSGLTSNPAIFRQALTQGHDYDDEIRTILSKTNLDTFDLAQRLAIKDIQMAADALRSVYEDTGGRDGYVSLEVAASLAFDVDATVSDAEKLWSLVDRPNLMIKVPGTDEGIESVYRLTSQGINVNVTLLFSHQACDAASQAYIRGLEELLAAGRPLHRVASVASVFVSRVDTRVDAWILSRIAVCKSTVELEQLRELRGQIALASSTLVYQQHLSGLSDPRWKRLEQFGARPQRLLWASTGTKNPDESDVKYVENLIAADTVTTLPPATLAAFRDHGVVKRGWLENSAKAVRLLSLAVQVGLPLEEIFQNLLTEGLKQFVEAADDIHAALEVKRSGLLGTVPMQHITPGEALTEAYEKAQAQWQNNQALSRLWQKDSSLWTGKDEHKWLDWLDCTSPSTDFAGRLDNLVAQQRNNDIETVVLIGMGGSSLGPEVIGRVLGKKGVGRLVVLDSTNPDQIVASEMQLDLVRTAFVVASKSGSTIEPNLLMDYFWARAVTELGAEAARARFVVITDPDSTLHKKADALNLRHVFTGSPGIGGRFSVLSPFGLVPAALIGVDVGHLLREAQKMALACGPSSSEPENPGVLLGCICAVAALAGRNKLTMLFSPELASFSDWLEQLLAESTGKMGAGILPVAWRGFPSAVDASERIFVVLRLDGGRLPPGHVDLDRLEAQGHPIIRINLKESTQLGQEFFRWEFAAAVMSALMRINPFDQPDVESSKQYTRDLIQKMEKFGRLETGELTAAQTKNLSVLESTALSECAQDTLKSLVADWLRKAPTANYIGVLAFLPHTESIHSALQSLCDVLALKAERAVSLQFGPRYLHSTGQLHKGGPPNGQFLMLSSDVEHDRLIPGKSYGFAALHAAQSAGDHHVLVESGRSVLRVHLGRSACIGLSELESLIRKLFTYPEDDLCSSV